MSDKKPEEVMEEAKKALENPLILTYAHTYYILYMIHRKPVEDSTYHVKEFSNDIPKLTKPDNRKNLTDTLKRFRATIAPKILKQHKDAVNITVLRAYLVFNEAEKFANNYNNQFAESKKVNQRTQSK